RKVLDQTVYNTLRDLINFKGRELYNNGDHNGCYRLYEGALITLKPLLDHRPALTALIDKGLAEAERNPVMARKAFVLRDVIDKARAEVNPNKGTTLWVRLGEEAGVRKVVDDFMDAAATDPKVDFFRGGKYKDKADVPKLKRLLVDQISQVAKGPYEYDGRDM